MRKIFAAVAVLFLMGSITAAAQVPVLVDDTGHEAGLAFPVSPNRFWALIPVNGIRYWVMVTDTVGSERLPAKGDGEWGLEVVYFSAANCTGNAFLSLSPERGSLGAPRLWVGSDNRAYTHVEPVRKIAIASYLTASNVCANQSFILTGFKATFVADLDLIYPLPLTVDLP